MACDLRTQKLAYAVFEFPSGMQLVDWGTRRFYADQRNKPALGDLLRLLHPSVLVLRELPADGKRNTPNRPELLNKIRMEARAAKTPIRWLNDQSLSQFFQKSGVVTKQQMAVSMAELFPEIAWKLPTPRKPWHPEHWRMPLFDAIALGFGYFALKMHSSDDNRTIK